MDFLLASPPRRQYILARENYVAPQGAHGEFVSLRDWDVDHPWRNFKYMPGFARPNDLSHFHRFLIYTENMFVPELVLCKFFKSEFPVRDIYFLAAFAYQNRSFINAEFLTDLLAEHNPNYDEEIVGREIIRLYYKLQDDDNMRETFFAFDIIQGYVLNLNDRPRNDNYASYHRRWGRSLYPDECAEFQPEYSNLFDFNDGYDEAMANLVVDEDEGVDLSQLRNEPY